MEWGTAVESACCRDELSERSVLSEYSGTLRYEFNSFQKTLRIFKKYGSQNSFLGGSHVDQNNHKKDIMAAFKNKRLRHQFVSQIFFVCQRRKFYVFVIWISKNLYVKMFISQGTTVDGMG